MFRYGDFEKAQGIAEEADILFEKAKKELLIETLLKEEVRTNRSVSVCLSLVVCCALRSVYVSFYRVAHLSIRVSFAYNLVIFQQIFLKFLHNLPAHNKFCQ